MKLLLMVAMFASLLTTASASATPTIIGHRGASGERPEHTAAAYRLAVEQGAHFVEPDLVISKDGVLICRHETALAIVDPETDAVTYRTTNVADRPEFADRKTTRNVDGNDVTGWFVEDFTVAELKTLRAIEPHPDMRPESAAHFGGIVTFDELLDLLIELAAEHGRPVGVLVELKHPSWFRAQGMPVEEKVVEALADFGGPAVIQSFDAESMRRMSTLTDRPIALLSGAKVEKLDLADVATYAQVLAVHKLGASVELAERCRAVGLGLWVWTLRAEPKYLPEGVATIGDEARQLAKIGVTGFITDHPGLVADALADQAPRE